MLPKIPEELRAKFHHYRYNQNDPTLKPALQDGSFTPNPLGGFTVCMLRDAEGKLLTSDVAVCSSKDNYNKRIGRNISLGRAVKRYNEQTTDIASKKDFIEGTYEDWKEAPEKVQLNA